MSVSKPQPQPKAAGPKPRDRSVRGLFEMLTRPDVVAILEKAKWAVVSTRLLVHGRRVVDSPSKSGFLDIVSMFTEGRIWGLKSGGKTLDIRTKGKAPEYTPTLITSDIAKIIGISKRQALKAVTFCIEVGFVERRGAEGEAAYQYRLNHPAIARARNAKDPEEIEKALKARQENAGKSKLQVVDSEEDSKGGCGTPGPHVRFLDIQGIAVQPGAETEVLRFHFEGEERRMFFRNLTGSTATLSQIVSDNGEPVLVLEAPIPTGAEQPQPSQQPKQRPGDGDELVVALAEAGYTPSPALLRRTAAALGEAPLAFLRAKLRSRNEFQDGRPKPRAKLLPEGALPSFAAEVAALWPAERAGMEAAVRLDGDHHESFLAVAMGYLEHAADAADAAGMPEIAAELRAVQPDGDVESLDSTLVALERRLITLARARHPEVVREFDALVAKQVRPRSMTTAQMTALQEQLFDRFLLERLQMPRLGVFYIEAVK